jgi:hypothetical protein
MGYYGVEILLERRRETGAVAGFIRDRRRSCAQGCDASDCEPYRSYNFH